jgi:hypothetical protein
MISRLPWKYSSIIIRGGDIPGCSSHSGMCWNLIPKSCNFIPSPGILFLLLGFRFGFAFDLGLHVLVLALTVENVAIKHSSCYLFHTFRSQSKGFQVQSVLHTQFQPCSWIPHQAYKSKLSFILNVNPCPGSFN